MTSLNVRKKWALKKRNFMDDVVIVKVENSQRCKWPLGRVTKTFPGRDGMVQSVELQVSNEEKLKRAILTIPISKLVLLVAAGE